jgi:RNA polymerase sigma factor (sigma-70 family)
MPTGISTLLDYLHSIATPPCRERSDGDLLAAYCAHRDETAFAELVHRHGSLVYGVCRRILNHNTDAEDAFQATFVLLARRAATVDPRRPLANWLYTVAYRTALKAKGRRARRRDVEKMAPTQRPDMAAVAQPDRQEMQDLLHRELLAIPADDRALILLCDIEGRPHRQVATELGIPSGSVSRQLAGARERLRARLTRCGVAITASTMAMLLSEGARAAVPSVLLKAAIHAAMTDAGGALASQSVAHLVAAVQRDVLLAKVKLGAAVLFITLGLAAASAGFLLLTRGPTSPSAQQESTSGTILESTKETDRGRPVKGLRLVLSADKTELVPGPDGKIAPITLRLHFHNESKQGMRIKTDNLLPTWEERIELTVTGPEESSVDAREQKASKGKPATGFFQPLDAGKSKLAGECKFPGPLAHGADGKVLVYTLRKSGKYRLHATYLNGDRAVDGVWSGQVTSNEIVLTLHPAERRDKN